MASERVPLAHLVKFGDDLELDPGAYELRRAGRPLKLERIPMELLLLLVEQRGQLVTREVLEAKEREAARALETRPDDTELAALRDWLSAFLVFVRLFDRAIGLVPQLEPRELERALSLLGRIPDSTLLRLFDLLGSLPDQDVIDLVDALSRLSPTAARRATSLMSGVIRTVGR